MRPGAEGGRADLEEKLAAIGAGIGRMDAWARHHDERARSAEARLAEAMQQRRGAASLQATLAAATTDVCHDLVLEFEGNAWASTFSFVAFFLIAQSGTGDEALRRILVGDLARMAAATEAALPAFRASIVPWRAAIQACGPADATGVSTAPHPKSSSLAAALRTLRFTGPQLTGFEAIHVPYEGELRIVRPA